jgi:hypothetical protein
MSNGNEKWSIPPAKTASPLRGSPIGAWQMICPTVETQPQAKPPAAKPTEGGALAQIEKWMGVIREIDHE